MKRKIALLLVLATLLGILAGCQPNDAAQETTVPAATQSPEEQEVLKFLCIGNSHGLDATNILYEVFRAEAPEKKVVLGAMYYQGCRLDQHASWIREEKPNYMYYKIDEELYKKTNGNWKVMLGKEVNLEIQDGATMTYVLQDEQWDVVSLQQMNTKTGLADGYPAEDIKTIVDHINKNLEVKPELGWLMIWTNPDEESLVSTMSGYWKDNYLKDYQQNQDVMYKAIVKQVKNNILTNDAFSFVVPAATAIHYAGEVCGVPDEELYRDYTHLSMTSRVIAAYMWYAQLMGLDKIEEIKLDVYPKILLPTKLKYMGDITLTAEQKDYILKSVNHALANPYEVPAQ